MPTPYQVIALATLGRVGQTQTALASLEAGGDNYFIAQVIVGTAAGEDPATVHARLQGIDRNNSKLAIWDFADAVEAALSVNQP